MTNKLTLGSWLGLFVLLGCAEERREWETEAGGVRARLDEAGLRLSTEAATIHLSLAGVGRPKQALSLTPPRFAPDRAGARLDRGSGVTEWAKLKSGTLEHGVTLDSPPSGRGPITLTVRVEGARPVVDADGRGADLVVPSGVVRYGELAVVDAAGRLLPSRMSASGSELFVELDDAGATYPVVIDPTIWAERAPLSGTEAFGYSVAVTNGMIFVGNPDADAFEGAVHVFAPSGDSFVEVEKLSLPADAAASSFGLQIAAASGVVAISALDSEAGTSEVDVLEVNGQMLSQTEQLTFLGSLESLATDGATILAGMLGQVLVFEKQAGAWALVQTLSGPESSGFGRPCAVSGEWALVGAPADPDAQGAVVGSVWIYHRVAGSWELAQVLNAATPVEFGTFGTSVAIDGPRAVVGSILTSHGLNDGSAYVFDLVGDTWTETTKLSPPNAESSAERFGAAVGLAGDQVVVGSPDYSLFNPYTGALDFFSTEGGDWGVVQSLTPTLRTGRFGARLAVEGRLVAVADKMGSVFPLVLVGQPCSAGDTCATGHCVDGYCCESPCQGQCEACDVSKNEGLCRPIVGAPHAGHPPCDASCVDGIATPAGSCDGVGTECTVPTSVPCAPFACGPTDCVTSCGSASDCAPGYGCDLSTRTCRADTPTCDGDHTLSRPDGTTESCAPYRCTTAGNCSSKCTQTGECVAGFVCASSGVCTKLDEQDSAGGCTLTGAGSAGIPGTGLALLLVTWARARRRRMGR